MDENKNIPETEENKNDNGNSNSWCIFAIIVGAFFLVMQILSWIGNSKAEQSVYYQPQQSKEYTFSTIIFDCISFFGYNLFGIIGAVLIIVGIKGIKKNNKV